MHSLIYLNKFFLKYKLKILIGFLFVILSNLFALLPANLIGRSFDLIRDEISVLKSPGEVNVDSLYYFLAIYASLLVFCALMRGVFMFYMRQNLIVVSRYIEYDLKNEIYQKYQYLALNFYQNRDSGDLLNRITEDVSRVRMYLGPAVMYSLNLLILITLILSRMFMVSPQLTIIVLLPLPLLSILIYNVSHKINLKSSVVQKNLSSLTSVTQSVFSGIRLVKSFVRENEVNNKFKELSADYMNNNISLSLVNSIFFPLVLFLVGFSVLLTIYFGGLFVLKDVVTVGQVAEFIIYVNMLTWPVTSIGWVTEVIQRAAASQYRINEFLDTKEHTTFYNSISNEKFTIPTKNIIFQDTVHKYLDSKRTVSNKINLTIPINQMVAFVGHVGSGKTTMIKLLSGLLVPSSGKIFFDNTDAQFFNWHQFRSVISYVSQDVFLFSDSIKNNILFGAENISDLALSNIIKNLCLFDEIELFSDKIDTHVGEGGITLSGGQKQRIALARAIIRKPRFLFLDDALSSVDSLTEKKIINFIQSELKDTTIVLTSNRLSVLKFCAKIFVLKEGDLVQQGTHNNLIKDIDGEYKKLFFYQMRDK